MPKCVITTETDGRTYIAIFNNTVEYLQLNQGTVLGCVGPVKYIGDIERGKVVSPRMRSP